MNLTKIRDSEELLEFLLSLKSELPNCCSQLKDQNLEQAVGHQHDQIHSLKILNQLNHQMCSQKMTFWLKETPCQILKEVLASDLKMKMMEQVYPQKIPQGREQLAYQPEMMRMDCNSVFPLGDQICMWGQICIFHVVHSECIGAIPVII